MSHKLRISILLVACALLLIIGYTALTSIRAGSSDLSPLREQNQGQASNVDHAVVLEGGEPKQRAARQTVPPVSATDGPGPVDGAVLARWRAHVSAPRDKSIPPDLVVILRLWSADGKAETRKLAVEKDGLTCFVEVNCSKQPAADLTVPPTQSSAAIGREIHFVAGSETTEELALAPVASLHVSTTEAGGPVAEAHVVVESNRGDMLAEALSDASGRANIVWTFAEHDVRVRVRKNGLAPLFDVRVHHPPERDLDIALQLVEAAGANVRVSASDGTSTEGIHVSLCVNAPLVKRSDDLNQDREEACSTGIIGPPGFVELCELPSGCAFIAIAESKEGAQGRVGVAPMTPAEVREVVIPLETSARCLVQVIDSAGAAVQGAQVGAGLAILGSTDARGQLRLIPPEPRSDVFLWSFKSGYAIAFAEHIDMSSGPIVQRLTLGVEGRIAGRVVNSKGAAVRWTRVTPDMSRGGGPTSVTEILGRIVTNVAVSSGDSSGDSNGDGSAERSRVLTDGEGRFHLQGLPVGRYTLDVLPPKSGCFQVENVSTGTENLEIVIPDLDAKGNKSKLVFIIAVRDRLTQVPINQAKVTILRVSPDGTGSFTTKNSRETEDGMTRADGTAKISYSSPGWFWIDVRAKGYMPLVSEIERFETGLVARDYELNVVTSLVVRILSHDGHPMSGVWVSLHDESNRPLTIYQLSATGSNSSESIQTDGNGEARNECVLPGRIIARARASYPSTSVVLGEGSVLAEPGKPAELILSVP